MSSKAAQHEYLTAARPVYVAPSSSAVGGQSTKTLFEERHDDVDEQ